MNDEKRRCENCGRKMFRAGYIPFEKGLIVCSPCFDEWQRTGEPRSRAELLKFYANEKPHI